MLEVSLKGSVRTNKSSSFCMFHGLFRRLHRWAFTWQGVTNRIWLGSLGRRVFRFFATTKAFQMPFRVQLLDASLPRDLPLQKLSDALVLGQFHESILVFVQN